MNRRFAALFSPLLGALLGCGVVLNGSRQGVVVRSEPPGAEVWTDGSKLQYWAPTGIQLSRKKPHTLRVELPGYGTETVAIRPRVQPGIVVLDILLTGSIGVIVDGLTGAWNALSPEETLVVLKKVAPVYAGRDSVEVRLRAGEAGLFITSSEPGIKLSIVRVADPPPPVSTASPRR